MNLKIQSTQRATVKSGSRSISHVTACLLAAPVSFIQKKEAGAMKGAFFLLQMIGSGVLPPNANRDANRLRSGQGEGRHNYASGKPMLGLRHLYALLLDLRWSTDGSKSVETFQRKVPFLLLK